MELAPLGVHVVTIQPGAIASHFGDAGAEHVQIAADSPYAPIAAAVSARARASQQGATPAADFAREVADHLLRPDPDPVCRAGAQSTRLPLLKRLLSTRRLDAVLRRRFGLDRLNTTR
jgi:NAD(P)-dependent dehydrogenase (short-subunit alcohol dehydrogenase family)